VVEPRAAPDGGHDAGRDADQDGDPHGHERQLDGDRQLLQDGLGDRQLGADRDPEIADENIAEPVGVLHRQRLVEPIFLADELDHLRVALLAR
jgi:hypothetical protein